MKRKPENILIIGTLIGIIVFYSVLGGFKRLSVAEEKKVL